MGRKKNPVVAICYDFDGTLSPGNMQEYNFIPNINMDSKEFWNKSETLAKVVGADPILTYMKTMLKEASYKGVSVRKSDFGDFGKKVKLYDGVEDWFDRIDEYAKNKSVTIKHYIISSGLKEMIDGTCICKKFDRIYASSFFYNENDVASWPAMAVNYTSKTQFLFRINKGALDVSDEENINKVVPECDRDVPFSRIVYLGDGSTDIPCMRLVKEKGGYSIAVYQRKRKGSEKANKLYEDGRVDYVVPADYTEDSRLDKLIKLIVDKIEVQNDLDSIPRS